MGLIKLYMVVVNAERRELKVELMLLSCGCCTNMIACALPGMLVMISSVPDVATPTSAHLHL